MAKENLEMSPGTKEIISGISKPGFVLRYTPEKRKGFESLAALMWSVFEENGIFEEGDKFKEFYRENFLKFDFETHRRMLSLLDFCREELTEEGGENFINALLSVGEERNYFDLGSRSELIIEIFSWDPFSSGDDRLNRWISSVEEKQGRARWC
jgi:hypothetical protein